MFASGIASISAYPHRVGFVRFVRLVRLVRLAPMSDRNVDATHVGLVPISDICGVAEANAHAML
jgi:hypothetical protein